MQQQVKLQYQRFVNFLEFAKHFAIRTLNPSIVIATIIENLKDTLSILKKKKMAKYRVDYQLYQLQKMEKLIAENNSHFFITGQNLNQLR